MIFHLEGYCPLTKSNEKVRIRKQSYNYPLLGNSRFNQDRITIRCTSNGKCGIKSYNECILYNEYD